MFWRFNYLTSEIDTLLDKEDVTLQDILSEDDVLQECKAQNKKLVDFLVRPENIEQLVNLVINEPAADTEERMKYKFPNIACELITSDVNQITEAVATNESLLNKIVNYLDFDATLNPLQASFFSKVMGLLITRKSELTLSFLKSKENFMSRVLHHLETSAIMDLLLRLITSMESQECKNACIAWLSEQRVVQELVKQLDPSQSSETHSNAAQSLCDIIRISREQMTQFQEQAIPDSLLLTIESEETVSMLLDRMFNGEKVESILTNGLYVTQTLLEFRKVTAEGQIELMTVQESEKMAQGTSNTLKAIIPRLKDFHKLLLEPPKQHYLPMPTTFGCIDKPLGNTRLQTVRLIAFLLATNSPGVNEELARLGTINVILNLYFGYVWNNFLHIQVEQCVAAIVRNDSVENEHILLAQLITECRLLQRIIDAFEENQREQSKSGGYRKGYMGHLTRIANSIVSNRVSSRNSQKIDELVQGLPDNMRDKWSAFVSGSLAELNKQNSTELMGGTASLPSSADADDDFRNIAFPQDVAQKLGFNGDDFNEQENMNNSSFGELSNRLSLSPTSCENTSSSAVLFEEMCSKRNQMPTIGKDDGNDEDLWEEKEIMFSPASPETPKSYVKGGASIISNTNESNSDGEEEEEEGEVKDNSDSDEDVDESFKQMHQIPESITTLPENVVEEMEFSSNDDWAKFDEVPMDVTPVTSDSPWKINSTVTGNQDAAESEGGWAKFDMADVDHVSVFPGGSWSGQESISRRTDQLFDVDMTSTRTAAYVVSNDYALPGANGALITDSLASQSTGFCLTDASVELNEAAETVDKLSTVSEAKSSNLVSGSEGDVSSSVSVSSCPVLSSPSAMENGPA